MSLQPSLTSPTFRLDESFNSLGVIRYILSHLKLNDLSNLSQANHSWNQLLSLNIESNPKNRLTLYMDLIFSTMTQIPLSDIEQRKQFALNEKIDYLAIYQQYHSRQLEDINVKNQNMFEKQTFPKIITVIETLMQQFEQYKAKRQNKVEFLNKNKQEQNQMLFGMEQSMIEKSCKLENIAKQNRIACDSAINNINNTCNQWIEQINQVRQQAVSKV